MEKEIAMAAERLKGIAKLTPLDFSKTFTRLSGNKVFLKMENLQLTGSFKIRGSFNKILALTEDEKKMGVIAASAGNHAQGVAYSATKAGIKSTIIMPKTASIIKVIATKNYGARVILHGENFDEALAYAQKLRKRKKLTFIHPYEDDSIIAGQGTIGLEILKQLPSVDAVVVPIGGGGLISGIAIAIKKRKPSVKIIGVQAENANAMYLSKRKGKLLNTQSSHTIADGIAVKHPGKKTFGHIKKYVDKIILVDDEEISSTIVYLLERAKLVVEPAGAASLAAILHKKIGLKNKKVVAVLSGGNIDIKMLDSLIRRGLIKAGRILEFRTILKDQPAELQKLLKRIADMNINVVSVYHDRIKPQKEMEMVEVELAVETSGKEHAQKLFDMLRKNGYEVMLK